MIWYYSWNCYYDVRNCYYYVRCLGHVGVLPKGLHTVFVFGFLALKYRHLLAGYMPNMLPGQYIYFGYALLSPLSYCLVLFVVARTEQPVLLYILFHIESMSKGRWYALLLCQTWESCAVSSMQGRGYKAPRPCVTGVFLLLCFGLEYVVLERN